MSFTIPNVADAAFSDQAQVDTADLQILAAGARQTGITSGCGVTTTGAGNGSVSVASGEARIADQLIQVSSATVALAANSSGNPRYDLITVGTSGTPGVTQGTAAATPVFPAIPASSVVLAAVRVPNGFTTSSVVAANTITDKRVDVSRQLVRSTFIGSEDVQHYIVQEHQNRVPVKIRGIQVSGSPWVNTLFGVEDYLGAPIAWVGATGGLWVNDNLQTAYTVSGPYPFKADIYGFQWRGKQVTFAFSGPPGNMLSWVDAVHEVFQGNRAASVGNWSVFQNCTLATLDLGVPPTSPTNYRSALRMTATATATAWISQPGGAFALPGVSPGDIISPIVNVRNNGAAARNVTVRLSWYTSGGTQIGADIDATISVPSGGAWTVVSNTGQVAPATAALVQIHVLVAATNGETYDMCGAGLMRGTQTAAYAPPFVAQASEAASPGDRWIRTDTPSIPAQREYVCETGGVTYAQKWRPLDTSTLYRIDVDQAFTSTTLANINALVCSVAANTSYVLEYSIFITSAVTTTGFQLGFTAPASPTYFFGVEEYQSSATAWTTATIQSATTFTSVASTYTATPNLIFIRIRAQIANGANAGSVALQCKTTVASSAITVKRGSLLEIS